ncbi:MAG: hypothetical protein JST32_13155 [Bacteroidetes bacterium]|nr:hypothetical protein [Bacteroidota bacterium]
MRTSLPETEQIDAHLLRLSEAGDRLVFEARLLLEPELRVKMHWQENTYALVKKYGREELKKEIKAVHQQLFTEQKHISFRQKILGIFSKK